MAARNFPSVSNLTHRALYRVTDNLDDCIRWCRGVGLLAAQMTCPTCQQPMRESADQKRKDGLRWR